MKKSRICLTGLLFILLSSNCLAAMNLYHFEDETKKARFKTLIHELRCTVCQNQTIADSNADLAKDLRDKVYKMIQDGKTDEEIKDFMVSRFTDFVLYNPPLKPGTYVLWLGPGILLIIAIFFLYRNIRRKELEQQNDFDESQKQRIANLLTENTTDEKSKGLDK